MINILVVGIGSMLGGVMRYLSTLLIRQTNIPERFATLGVNVTGGLVMGIIMGVVSVRGMSDTTRLFLTTGLMGGLTTFSTFSQETVTCFEQGQWVAGTTHLIFNVACSLLACWLGHALGRQWS